MYVPFDANKYELLTIWGILPAIHLFQLVAYYVVTIFNSNIREGLSLTVFMCFCLFVCFHLKITFVLKGLLLEYEGPIRHLYNFFMLFLVLNISNIFKTTSRLLSLVYCTVYTYTDWRRHWKVKCHIHKLHYAGSL